MANSSLAATTFYEKGAVRPQHPGQRELMSDILYGAAQLEAEPRRSRAVSARAFANAAGHKHNVADLPEQAAADHHPHIQRAIRAEPDRRCTRDSIAHDTHAGLTAEPGAAGADFPGLHRAIAAFNDAAVHEGGAVCAW